MYDLICVGNISIDLYYKGKSLTNNNGRFQLAIGGKYQTDYFYEDIGGGGCNVAIGTSILGLKTAIFAKVGNNPFKETILKKLKNKNVSTEFCQFEDNYYKISTILLTEFAERTIINYETPNHLVKEFFLNNEVNKVENIYISPLPTVSLKQKAKIISYLKGDQTLTFINLSIEDCRKKPEELKEIFNALDVLIVNAHEYSELVRQPYEKIDFKNLQLTLPYLKDRILIITDAEKGSYGYYKKEKYFQEAIEPKKIIDTTGCGDAYTAGFIVQYLKSKDIKSSMESGAKYAADKLTRIGAN